MYNNFFGLRDKPFSIAPDPRYLFMSEQHREALAHLMYGVGEGGGFVLLTGEVGTGKTTVCRCLLEQMPDNSQLAFILNPKLNAQELLASVCDELHIDYPEQASLKQLNDALNAFLLSTHAQGKKTILMIDEAQNLAIDVLEQIRLLTNLETNEQKLLQIILIGQPELNDLLDQHELRQLAQRITARFHLRPLSLAECQDYIAHRLSVSGMNGTVFNTKAIEEVFKRSGGVPRLINVLCDRAMLGAYAQNRKSVDVAMIKRAATEIMGGKRPPEATTSLKTSRSRPALSPVLLVVMVIVVGVAGFLTYEQYHRQEILKAELQAKLQDQEKLQQQAKAIEDSNAELQQRLEQLEEEKRQREMQLLPFLPADIRPTDDRQALKSLLNLWQESSPGVAQIDNCADLGQVQKQCETIQGDWSDLLRVDRPAIISLNSTQGVAVYGVIVGLDEQRVRMLFDGQVFNLSRDQLMPYWNGLFTFVWSTPPGYREPLRLQMSGPPVQWLKQRLAQVKGVDLIVPPTATYDLDLQFEVLNFQKEYGLRTDAVAGPETLVMLSSLVSYGHPTLAIRGES